MPQQTIKPKRPRRRPKPRRIRVARNAANTVNDYIVPVILIPGIMGSRLQWQATYKGNVKDFYWDPDNTSKNIWKKGAITSWTTYSADEERQLFRCMPINDVQTQSVMRENDNLSGNQQLTPDEINRGWGGTANSKYGEFLRTGRDSYYSQTLNPIYAFGYDWRNSNYNSGKRLSARVSEILNYHGADKCVIVTHSMGGLVARSALRWTPGLSDKVITVVHTCQPVLGAPVAYRRFFTGVRASTTGLWSDVDGDTAEAVAFSYIVGSSAESFIKVMTVLDGAAQLMPADGYPNVKNFPWLRYVSLAMKKANQVGSFGDKSIYENYVDGNQPPGSILNTNNKEWKPIRDEFINRLVHARDFHNALRENGKIFHHPLTFSLYSKGRQTDVMVEFEQIYENWYSPSRANLRKFWVGDGGYALALTDWQRPRDGGDGTVPEQSATALFPDQQNNPAPNDWRKIASNGDGNDNGVRQYFFNGIEHAEALNNSDMSRTVSLIIYRVLRYFGKVKS